MSGVRVQGTKIRDQGTMRRDREMYQKPGAESMNQERRTAAYNLLFPPPDLFGEI
jgi:hypothetical protein